jgi:D-methionine transport system substrate-binding protein
MRAYKQLALVIALSCTLIACHKPDANTLIIGTISGPETELVDVAQHVAKERYGLTVKIIEFNDYNLPNEALMDGTLDANIYQHEPYLNAASKAHGYQFEVIGKTFIYPTGIYSNKVQTLKALSKHALIALPNDPSNEARALLLLDKAGLITLHKTSQASVRDIIKNRKQLRFKELDAAQLPRILPDVDAAIINTTFAIPAGLRPTQDALFLEDKHSPYANLIVIRKNTLKKAQLEQLVQAFHSPEVKAKAQALFGDAAMPAW